MGGHNSAVVENREELKSKFPPSAERKSIPGSELGLGDVW